MIKMKDILKGILYFMLALFWVSCAARMAFQRGEEAYQTKNWDRAVEDYMKAVQAEPANPRYRISLAKALIEASNYHREMGDKFLSQGELKLALIEFQKALDNNPENLRAKKGKNEILSKIEEEKKKQVEKTDIEKAKERARKTPLRQPLLSPGSESLINLKFSLAELKDIFKALQEASGIDILFEDTFKSKKVSIDLINVTFEDALNKLLLISGLFYKVIDEKTILVIPDTPAKRKEYEELILKTFYLSNADLNQIQSLLRILADIKIIAVNPDLNTVLIRENKKKVDIAEKIIASQDKSAAELVIDVEILEVNKSRMREYGIELSQYQIIQSLSPDKDVSEAASSLVRGHMFYSIDSSDFLFSIPSISYKLLEGDAESRIIAKPQLRVLDKEKVVIQLGDKVPVPVTTFVPIAAGGPSQQAITSFQMYDVGINLELTPRVHHNGEITLKLKFELTFITAPGSNAIPPTIGNRSVETIIRMRDNETGLLAGLLRDSERKGWKGVPGLRSIPILNLLFGGTTEEISQTDIILTLTPRITRMPDISEEDMVPLWIGTEKDLGLRAAPPPTPFDDKTAEEERETEERLKIKEKAEETKKAESRETARGEQKRQEMPEERKQPELRQAEVSFFPPSSEVATKTQFMKRVVVENVENIASLVLSLSFDPALLQVREVREGNFMNKDGVRTSFLQTFNNTTGNIQIGISREGFRDGVSGVGEIAAIIFESIKEGKSAVAVSGGGLRNSLLLEVPVKFKSAEVVIK